MTDPVFKVIQTRSIMVRAKTVSQAVDQAMRDEVPTEHWREEHVEIERQEYTARSTQELIDDPDGWGGVYARAQSAEPVPSPFTITDVDPRPRPE